MSVPVGAVSFAPTAPHNAAAYPLAPQSKIGRIWSFVHECIVKEFGSCLRHTWYRAVFWMNPHKNGLNPEQIKAATKTKETAKVVLLLHGAGAHASSFIPMAKKLSEANVTNIFTVTLNQSDKDPVPIAQLAARIQEVTQKYLAQGYSHVDFALVGHSLGALVAAKYTWRNLQCVLNTHISLIISIAGRLKYLPNRFAWFCEGVRPDVEATFQAMVQDPQKAHLLTIWGDRDGIVPKGSAHIQGQTNKECTVKGWGHGGVVFAPEAHNQVAAWAKQWLQA